MQPLKPLDIPLSGKNLIQASAGTGKTWTISLLYVRLVVEQLLTAEQMLVVTYTRAATEELRGRIRQRLKEALAAYEQPEGEHADEYLQLLARHPATPERIWYLQRALLGFDEAAVFTIHGFCQRVLQQHAFEVGLPFESELIDNEFELQLALADQFWQQHLLQPHALYAAVLQRFNITPDSLLQDVAKFIGKPYLQVVRAEPISPDDYAQAQQSYAAQYQQLQHIWQTQAEAIKEALASPALNKQSYKEAQVQELIARLQDFFRGQDGEHIRAALGKLCQSELNRKTKKGQTSLQHTFFEQVEAFLPAYDHLAEWHAQALEQLRYELLEYLRTQLPERKRQAGLLAFDDLLISLQQALLDRPALAEQLRQQYPVALIDEFQDTDPVQYQVFEAIYAHTAGQLYYVGDPKQAIYGFRGADIYTYLQAASSVEHERQYTLDKNFRSQPRLLEAFNQLYFYSGDPFRNGRQIDYENVKPGGVVTGELITPQGIAPLRIWDWDGTQAETPAKQSDILPQIAAAVADDIAQLLQYGQQGTASIKGEALSSRHFAILVRSHHQGRIIKKALQERGIASVQQSQAGIFQTPEAQELRWVLAAIAEPNDLSKIRRALTTELMGATAQSLLAMEQEAALFDRELEAFYHWQQLWQQHGFMRMLRHWLASRDVRKRLLSYVDGERRLTNLLHLSELIHRETRHNWQSIPATLRWLRRCANAELSEEQQLRLESDENLVQIVTIHKSKGLQYPIVYCPFLWTPESQKGSKAWFVWHDKAQGYSCLQAGQEGREEAWAQLQAENRSESQRLLYVALTRAQYHCTVVTVTGEINKLNYDSPINWLLFGHLPDSERLLATKSQLAPEKRQQAMQAALRDLEISANHCIACDALPVSAEKIVYHSAQDSQALQARTFKHRVPSTSRIGSFTGLTAGRHDERPDHDQVVDLYNVPAPSQPVTSLAFPGGRRAGVCLHKLLEKLDFCAALSTQRDTITAPILQAQGYEAAWLAAAENLLQHALQAPLLADSALCLNTIPRRQRLDEMEFYFPVNALQVKLLQQLLAHYLPSDWQAIRAAAQQLDFSTLRGYMKGYIDLLFEHEGQFYIVDYKSNYLGDMPEDYAPAKLHTAMAEAHYYLQYLIYCVAVQRYLKQRLGAAYSWDNSVGGVFYLFLRGMGQGTTQNGIFFHKPSTDFIDALDGLMEL